MTPLVSRTATVAFLALTSALAAAQILSRSVDPGPIPQPGTYRYGSLQSLLAIDGGTYGLYSANDPNAGSTAALEMNFSGVPASAATLKTMGQIDNDVTSVFAQLAMILTAPLLALPFNHDYKQADGDFSLVLSTIDQGTLRLSRYGLAQRKPAVVWTKRLLPKSAAVLDAVAVGSGRIALLYRQGAHAWCRSVNVGSGVLVGPAVAVGFGASGLGLFDGHPVLVSQKGLSPLIGAGRSASDEPSSSVGFLSPVWGGAAYTFALDAEGDLSHGFLAAYRLDRDRLRQTYRRDVAPGPYAFATQGKRLIVLLSGGPMEVYSLETPTRPRLAGSYGRQRDWIALGSGAHLDRFYALERDGRLQAYRFDDARGLLSVTDAASSRPVYPARLCVSGRSVSICGSDGTVQLFRTSGTKIELVGERSFGKGPVWVLG